MDSTPARAPVNRILRSSIVDGPGNRAAVFLQGCNFDCVYCHNPETITLCSSCGTCVPACPAGALSVGESGGILWNRDACTLCDSCLKTCPHNSSPRVRLLSPKEVMAEIEPSIPFIRGITVSGGECTLYPDFLRELGELARERSLSFFLDSNGSYDFAADRGLMEITDSVMLDVKADPENGAEYRRVTGNDGKGILDKAEYLAKTEKLYELRTVVSPGLFDPVAVVEKACRRIVGTGSRYKLIRYRPVGVRQEAAAALAEPDDLLMEKLAGICAGHGIEAVIV
ncbi:radical SAM [Treponema primitia ZAS-2]|uniref:Radical SAM n=1 Tax=Treponema primitia (strain ATCC BAA-887 / DSM 12427 / ZAS-2) TaxID=545694 RepID=F5YPT2_TREPZ|nr:radical SAM [Treponema primitia ZAS-2]